MEDFEIFWSRVLAPAGLFLAGVKLWHDALKIRETQLRIREMEEGFKTRQAEAERRIYTPSEREIRKYGSWRTWSKDARITAALGTLLVLTAIAMLIKLRIDSAAHSAAPPARIMNEVIAPTAQAETLKAELQAAHAELAIAKQSLKEAEATRLRLIQQYAALTNVVPGLLTNAVFRTTIDSNQTPKAVVPNTFRFEFSP